MEQAKLIIFLLIVIAAFGCGVKVSDWRHDSIEYAARVAAEAAAEVQARRESAIAANVEKVLRSQRWKERVIENRIHEVTQREIYKTDCIDDDGLDIVNGVLLNPDKASKTGVHDQALP